MKRQSLGRVNYRSSHTRPLHITDPLASRFNPPVGDSPGELFKYLMACQVKAYGKTILSLQSNQYMHIKHLKSLLNEFDPLTIKRAILYASLRCRNPFGIRWIKVYAKNMKDMMDGIR